MTPRQRGLCKVDELFEASYWAPGTKAALAIQSELI